MAKKPPAPPRREGSLSRDRIIEAAIVLLDEAGESGLTFRALAERLVTGPGAIYWHIANKGELLIAACDAIVARAMSEARLDASPEASIRAIALGMFDAIDEHPWVGSALTHAPGQLPAVRLLERLGRSLRELGVRREREWTTVSALLSYVLGVGAQNAANRQFAFAEGLERDSFLASVSTAWSELDAAEYPFARSIAAQLSDHDDREDFLAGIDLILGGIHALT
ncbi:TetR family transcriptional regulator [Luteibacter rhizovicinus DSM 16549]|uniref:TetR family transcriptional regulator n=1 Tax=Luteibacter rhizovicinus DSM 16549 TaxID=1440763 RepID=A0A0G9HDX6_9GAMM|nr:TetR/AcrR family transcriptional regulator [Luteibacter rhizovicinus]APG05338.1 TetR family transcriptional regulator [Luteibacter rhizovicinus DSM 16549]KLD67960.1 TetR family transcriptional regulator [Luteibacter rhizovicinus DSM 16549]